VGADDQLDLFGDAGPAPVAPIRPDEGHLRLAAALPAGLRLGTSSWSFPGWAGSVYTEKTSAERLARHGLAAYAQHPLLRAVGLDRSYYAPLEARELARCAAVVPDGFRFVMKAHDELLLERFPRHARYGPRAGEENARFLDPAHATERVIGPAVEGLGRTLGAILFQFTPERTGLFAEPDRFADRLHAFLAALPRGPLYAVELRTRSLLVPRYVAALRDAGATHCLNVHPTMPDLARQEAAASEALRGRALVARWMLPPTLRYEEARDRFAPFDRLAAPDPVARRALAEAAVRALDAGREALVIVNNKAEGSAPLSVFGLAQAVARRLGRA
jgi:uncharacterized protein YecE (DUF72 family)